MNRNRNNRNDTHCAGTRRTGPLGRGRPVRLSGNLGTRCDVFRSFPGTPPGRVGGAHGVVCVVARHDPYRPLRPDRAQSAGMRRGGGADVQSEFVHRCDGDALELHRSVSADKEGWRIIQTHWSITQHLKNWVTSKEITMKLAIPMFLSLLCCTVILCRQANCPRPCSRWLARKPEPARLSNSVLVIIDAQREYVDGALPLSGVDAAID